MSRIAIISSSVRNNRKSHAVALYMQKVLSEQNVNCEILDLHAYKFPIFEERLKYQIKPSDEALDFSRRIQSADGVIIVTPEYNGGYPASIKNAIDLLITEWIRKPVAISTVSDGSFGGSQVIMSLQFSLWKMKAWTVPAMFPVPKVNEVFNESGLPVDRVNFDKRLSGFLKELFWCIEAAERMKK